MTVTTFTRGKAIVTERINHELIERVRVARRIGKAWDRLNMQCKREFLKKVKQ
jgi:hypothetical protein